MATKQNVSVRDEKFCKQSEKSTDYSTLCMATMSEENAYASVIADEVAPNDKVKPQKEEKGGNRGVHVCWLAVFAFMVVVIMAIVQVTCLIAILVNVAELKAREDSLQQLTQSNEYIINNSTLLLQQLTQSNEIIINNSNELNCQQFSREYKMAVQFLNDSITEAIDILQSSSCAALPPSSPSDYYWVRASNGSAVRVYCDMTRSCGGVTGGWMRVAELDMTNSSHQCPSGLTLRTESDSNIRACVTASTVGCVSIPIDIPYSYSRVCGRVIAYQVGATNAFHHYGSSSIDDVYVDGVSLTHGNPRQHIWTFAVGLQESMAMNVESTCPCTGSDGATPSPSFVGSDYFCEAGLQDYTPTSQTLYSNDPLWDGVGCTDTNPCCSFNNPPWFYKQLPQPTTDNIEMRVCKDEDASNEDVAIEIVEIYVQ